MREMNVDGLHLDYIRYKGKAADKWGYVSSFVKEVRKTIDRINPGIKLSMASKAEDYESPEGLLASALYYGQNYEDLSSYVDMFIPMTYYLDYNVSPADIVKASVWIKEITGREVYAGIQLHPSENPKTKGREPTIEELREQLKLIKEKGLDGACFFRFKHLYEKRAEIKQILHDIQ